MNITPRMIDMLKAMQANGGVLPARFQPHGRSQTVLGLMMRGLVVMATVGIELTAEGRRRAEEG